MSEGRCGGCYGRGRARAPTVVHHGYACPGGVGFRRAERETRRACHFVFVSLEFVTAPWTHGV
eukprot:972765-Prymnesium_polylepis.1